MNENIERKVGITRTSRLRVGAVWCAAVGVTFYINLQWS